MNVKIIVPPILQINAPYPSGAYLSAFFKSQNCNAQWFELNIQLFYSIFSSQGLTKLFELSEEKALKLAQQAESQNDQATAFNLRRYVSTSQNWINWIDWITAILREGANSYSLSSREKSHQFLYSPFAPRGNRMLNFMENLSHEPTVDDVRMLCTLALADLSDYITIAFDNNFSLVRYAESLAVDDRNFSQIQNQLDSPVMKHFYKPILENCFGRSGSQLPSGFCCKSSPAAPVFPPQSLTLVCISIPFAGTLLPALYTARFLKESFGDSVYVCIGGGFVNTELRNAKQPELAKYVDAISYDRGYGSYYELLNTNTLTGQSLEIKPIYKLRQFVKSGHDSVKVIEPQWENSEISKIENDFTIKLVPDYSDIDFSIYPRVSDDVNPMHRLWTDGAWIKAYLAHGCYWHKCAFCDTQLDYVCAYKPVEVDSLYKGLAKTSVEKGVYGIHFVDEALPPAAIKEFALQNLRNNGQLYYWGNVRFEKTFTKDLAAFLSYGGFAAVSAGLEVATGSGLKNINKGTDIESIVSACAAFKEAGILVHAYMIYGFWNDTPQSIIDSMETLRQFFEAGLLDSAFWHKFVLTRNSQVFSEWEKGLHPELKPILPKDDGSMFAQNNLRFKGEDQYNKFGSGLENALNSWMHGEHLQTKVQKWFDFQVPAPSIPKNYIERFIEKYEERNNKNISLPEKAETIYWLGSKPVVCGNTVSWIYLQEESFITHKQIGKLKLEEAASLLWKLRPEAESQDRSFAITEIKKSPDFQRLLQSLHNIGVVSV